MDQPHTPLIGTHYNKERLEGGGMDINAGKRERSRLRIGVCNQFIHPAAGRLGWIMAVAVFFLHDPIPSPSSALPQSHAETHDSTSVGIRAGSGFDFRRRNLF